MNNININSIFGKNSSNGGESNKPLDVHTLFHSGYVKTDAKPRFSVDSLINEREEKKKKVIYQYKRIFHMCLKKIQLANRMNKYEILYEVPEAIFMYPEYNSYDCLKYIDDRVKKLFMDTCILSNKTIFITWYDIKENKRIKESKKDN